MAFLDFMNQGVGGMTPAQTSPGVMGEGSITTAPAKPIGPTYSDLARGMMTYGSSPGSSAPRVAQAMPSSSGMYGQQALTPLSPNAPPQQKKATGQGGENSDENLAAISKFIMQMFGGV